MSFFSPGTITPRFDHAAVQLLLAQCLPDERHQCLVPLGEGDFCLAFREQTRVLRVARHAAAAAALRAEACVLSRVADQLPLPVPRPTYYEPEGCPPFSIHEELSGEILTQERWLELSMAGRRRVAAELAAFLRALHDLRPEAGRSCGLRRLDQVEFASRLLEHASATLSPLLDPQARQRLDGFLTGCAASSWYVAAAAVLLHCDVAPGHVLFDPAAGRLTGIIDFGDLALGDPARDFVYIYEDFGSEMLAAVLSRYQREEAAALLPRIRTWYLLEAVSWTMQMVVEQREAETAEGIGEILRELTTPGLVLG